VIACCWNNYGGHDGGNVKCWPSEHLVKNCINCKVSLTMLCHSLFHGESTLIIDGLRLISIIICLNQEPSCITKFVKCMNTVCLAFNNRSFIRFHSRNNVIHWRRYSFLFQSFNSASIVSLLFQSFFQKPASRNSIIFNNTDQIIFETFSSSCIHIDCE